MGKIKGRRAAPKRRNIIHRHAKLRSGAGTHKDKRIQFKQQIEREDMQMTMHEFRELHSIENGTDMMEAMEQWSTDETVPAICNQGCEVEPDGKCEHGCPSILIRMGVIVSY